MVGVADDAYSELQVTNDGSASGCPRRPRSAQPENWVYGCRRIYNASTGTRLLKNSSSSYHGSGALASGCRIAIKWPFCFH